MDYEVKQLLSNIEEAGDNLNLGGITPVQYFEVLKNAKKNITREDLDKAYDACLQMAHKYQVTGQTRGLKRLAFSAFCITKEYKLLDAGINTYVYREDIETYIDDIADDAVKIIELENYEREIPDEVVVALEKVKGLFDQFYVVYTDYTRKETKRVQAERREKDPILFGTFQNAESKFLLNRFYYIADWIDEYCDLTLDKLICELQDKKQIEALHTFNTPMSLEELKKQVAALEEKDGKFVHVAKKRNNSLFSKVKTFFSGGLLK